MAREFKLLFALWLVVACLGAPTAAQNNSTATPTSTSVPPSATPTSTSVSPSATPTSTGVPPSATPTSTGVPPSATPTSTGVPPSATPTSTGVPPSATPTSTGVSPSATPTSTGVPPSATPTSTGVPPSATPTSTGVPPSATPTSTGVPPSATPTSTGPSTTLTPATTTSPLPPTTKLPGPCDGKPCGDRSTCEPRSNQTFVCLCLAGDSYDYNNDRCVSAKVFPGLLQLPDLTYNISMSIKTSPVFKETSLKITELLNEAFDKSDGVSQVVELSKLDSKVSSRLTADGVRATVEIIFKANANIDTAEVEKIMIEAKECSGCLLENATFAATDLCEDNPCDLNTTTCSSVDGNFNCTCLKDYIVADLSNRMCIACPSGQQAEDSKTCGPCPFGYSGLNCSESWKLSLVIVGSVLGGMLLITLILLPVLALKSSKKSSKKDTNADMGKPYISHPPAKQPLVNSNFAKSQAASVNGPANGLSAFANAGLPRIPRATTTNSWDSRTNLEMNLSNSRQNLIPAGGNSRLYDDHDDMNRYAQVRPQSGLNAQARPQYNPYAQNQPQTNPYAQSQGNSNPYYMHDNGRRLN